MNNDHRPDLGTIDLSDWSTPDAPYSVVHDGDPNVAHFNSTVPSTVVKNHKTIINKSDATTGHANSVAVATRTALDHAASDLNQRNRDLEAAKAEEDYANANPDRCETRRIGTLGMVLALAVLASFLFLIDRIQLRVAFFTESLGTVTLAAFFIAVGHAVSAHITGANHKHCVFADKSYQSRQLGTWQTVRAVVGSAGLGSEIILGVLRAARTGQLLTSVVLTCVGIAFWFAAAGVSYLHAATPAAEHAAASKRRRRAHRSYRVAERRHRKAEPRAHGAQQGSRHARSVAVADWDSEVYHLNVKRVRTGYQPVAPTAPPAVRDWRRESLNLPEWLTLPSYTAPFINAIEVTRPVPPSAWRDRHGRPRSPELPPPA